MPTMIACRDWGEHSAPGARRWGRCYALSVVALDAVSLVVAATMAQELLRFGFTEPRSAVRAPWCPISLAAVAMALLCLGVIALGGGYESSPESSATGLRRVCNAARGRGGGVLTDRFSGSPDPDADQLAAHRGTSPRR
jgi:hypothetical protein